ncbi:MAG: hypothetical protein USCAAHI_01265 [Beijerinckiaceae bacterium]|nr:MAG: hypothetical protein USCAAHI_01265 [Beijerinckiaceae bacterium]
MPLGKVEAVAVEQIEQEVAQPVPAAGFQIRLQIVQTGNAGRVFDDDFPVDQRRAETKFPQCIRDAAKAVRPVNRLSGEQPNARTVDACLHPVAVMLDLVNPLRATRRLLAGRRQARLKKCRQQALLGAADLADVGKNYLTHAGRSRPRLVVLTQFALGRKLLIGAAADLRWFPGR